MSTKPKTIDVSILGRTYKVACTDEERESLLAAVDYLDAKMSEIKETGKVASVERIAVMAALNISHELLSQRDNATVADMHQHGQEVPEDGFDFDSVKRRMISMQALLDDVLLPQDRLI